MAVAFKVVEHFITKQFHAEQEMMATYNAGNYTIDKPYVKLNPYFVAPLTALIMFKTEEEVSVTLTVKGKCKKAMKGLVYVPSPADVTHTFEKAKEHKLPVLGLYGDYENTVVIQLSNGQESEVKIKTNPIPETIGKCTYMNTTDTYMGDNMMFVTPAGASCASAYDYNGECRWYTTETFIFDMKRARNGNILVGADRFISLPYYTTGVCEISLVGKIYAEYRIPGAYHHDQFEMEDGNLLVLTQEAGADTVEDVCILIDRKTGEILKTWDYKKVLPQNKGKSGSWSAHDWFHNNAVWYDKKTHSLTLSGRHQDIVINIDYDTGDLKWIIGDPEGWPEDMVAKYFFTPVGEGDFDWQYEQHACVILPDGDVMMFDNGHWRAKDSANYILNKDNFSRGVRYRIDTEKMTIEQVWQFGKDRGAQFFSPYICNVEYYGEGHYLTHSGGVGYYDGKATESLGAFLSEEDPKTELKSITVETKDDIVVFEMHVRGNYYRAEKLPFYHDGENLVFGKGQLLGNLAVTEQFLTEIPAEDTGRLVPDKHELKFLCEEDRIILEGKFEAGQVVMLQLVSDEEALNYFVPTTKMSFMAMCVGTFQQSDERVVKYNLNKEGLCGTYRIKIIVEDKQYETGIIVNI